MSGSRALASARRRRAGGAENSSSSSRTPPPPPKPASLPAPMSSSTMGGSNFEANEPPQPPKKMTPTAMLLNHNKVIENLQDVVTNLDSAFASQQQEIDQKLSSLSLDDSNIEFFKQKVKDLDTQLREIKKHILKVQTFAMETNLQCMEMKKKMNESGDSQEVQLERAEEISTILSDSNEGEVTA
jgi:esterase/lipase